jgi:DNA invertase Pin-like site-specific DNA recombinase
VTPHGKFMITILGGLAEFDRHVVVSPSAIVKAGGGFKSASRVFRRSRVDRAKRLVTNKVSRGFREPKQTGAIPIELIVCSS